MIILYQLNLLVFLLFSYSGIIFDTFKNTENLSAHRDVTVLVNDGDKTFELMTDDIQGCNTNVRYHSERADFSVSDSSRAKIVISGNRFLFDPVTISLYNINYFCLVN